MLGVHSRLMAIAVIGSAVVLILAGMFTPAPLHTVAAAESDLDRAMPSWQFDEHHAIRINASPERVYRAVKDTTAGEILFFGALVWIRRLGRSGPESILNAPAHRPLLDVATRTTFATLTDTQHEIVIGTVVVAPPGVRRARQPTPEELLLVQRRDWVCRRHVELCGQRPRRRRVRSDDDDARVCDRSALEAGVRRILARDLSGQFAHPLHVAARDQAARGSAGVTRCS